MTGFPHFGVVAFVSEADFAVDLLIGVLKERECPFEFAILDRISGRGDRMSRRAAVNDHAMAECLPVLAVEALLDGLALRLDLFDELEFASPDILGPGQRLLDGAPHPEEFRSAGCRIFEMRRPFIELISSLLDGLGDVDAVALLVFDASLEVIEFAFEFVAKGASCVEVGQLLFGAFDERLESSLQLADLPT